MVKKTLAHPLTIILGFAFLVMSWPFVRFPLTDADIAHWVLVVTDLVGTHRVFTGANDQAHGPLLAWGSAIFVLIRPSSLYFYNLFNLFLGMFGVALVYRAAGQLWSDRRLPALAAAISATSISVVYFSRTPMYDWGGAIFFFGFCLEYWLYVKRGWEMNQLQKGFRPGQLALAMVYLALASMFRFSMTLGLAGVFFVAVQWMRRRSLSWMVIDGLVLSVGVALANLPWMMGQTLAHGMPFVTTFAGDNVGRFIREPGHAPVRHDHYAFLIYSLLAIIPYPAFLIGSLTRWDRIKALFLDEKKRILMLMAGPCFLLFSMSGHVKLARYGSFIYLPLLLLTAVLILENMDDAGWQKRVQRIALATWVGVSAILGMLVFQFHVEVAEARLLAGGIIFLLGGLFFIAFGLVKWRLQQWVSRPHAYLVPFLVVYLVFFSILSFGYGHYSFLTSVRDTIHMVMP